MMKTSSWLAMMTFFWLLGAALVHAQLAVAITGKVTDIFGSPVQGAVITLAGNPALSSTSGVDGTYSLNGQLSTHIAVHPLPSQTSLRIDGQYLFLTLYGNAKAVTITAFSLSGRKTFSGTINQALRGSYPIRISNDDFTSSALLILLDIDGRKTFLKTVCMDGAGFCSARATFARPATSVVTGTASASDSLRVTRTGFDVQVRPIAAFSGVHDFVLVNSTVNYSASTVALPVKTTLTASHTSISNYGIKPQIILLANSDNSFDVGLYASTTGQLQLVRFDANGVRTGDLIPGHITGATALVGLARVTDDGSFVAGYAKNNAHGDAGFEYWITRFTAAGAALFSTRIFGDRPSTELWAKGEPGTFSSGRMAFNPVTKKIGFYCGHTMKWDDGVRHQGGFVGFMNLSGAFDTANGWFFSHNFDTRMLTVDSAYYLLAHGDAYPRALGFSKWNDVSPRGKKLFDSNYYKIAGPVGDNATRTQTGGFIRLTDGTFGVVFASSDSSVGTMLRHASSDVCFKKISATGKTLATVWLTAYPSTTRAIFPRIAPWGAGILVAWEEVTGNVPVVQVQFLDNAGNALMSKKPLAKASLSPFYDFATIPKGDILWATIKGTDSLVVHRIAK